MSDDATPAKVRLTDKLGPDERLALDALLDHIYEYGTNSEGVLTRAAKLCEAARKADPQIITMNNEKERRYRRLVPNRAGRASAKSAWRGARVKIHLVLVEWVDSSQPVSAWHFLDDSPALEVVHCTSVGWLVKKDARALMLAPNIGGTERGDMAQGSGFVRIPRSAVTRVVALEEAAVRKQAKKGAVFFRARRGSHAQASQR